MRSFVAYFCGVFLIYILNGIQNVPKIFSFLCVCSVQKPLRVPFGKIFSSLVVSEIWLRVLYVILQDYIYGLHQDFVVLFIQKEHNAVGCQESEQLGKI